MNNDIVKFKSSDGVTIEANRKALEFNAKGFPPSALRLAVEEPVDLPEDLKTLELFFKFTSPVDHGDSDLPDLEDLPWETFFPLAVTAEKYQANVLMYICRRRMRILEFSSYQLDYKKYHEAISYAVEHDYPEILDKHIGQMLRVPLADLSQMLTTKYLIAWAQYMQNWNAAIIDFTRNALREIEDEGHRAWKRQLSENVAKLAAVASFKDIQTTLCQKDKCESGGGWNCTTCAKHISRWKTDILSRVAKLTKLSDLVN